MTLHLDYETRSQSDLTEVGAFRYANDPSTRILCAAIAVADQRDSLKAEAVKRGFAEWHVLGQDSTEFRWKEAPPR